MRRLSLWIGVTGAIMALAPPALAANADGVNYTHASTLTQDHCPVYENYPKEGVPVRSWTASRRSPGGATRHLGLRYTYKGYAMVLDHARSSQSPRWGFVLRSCLSDPFAYDAAGRPLGDLRAIGGGGGVKGVPISAPHDGKERVATIHVASGTVGTLRSAPKSFVIGNVRGGDPLQITTAHCGRQDPEAWILGYAPNSGRWGYVQARVLPACT
jgi:hypothetical protein